MSESNNKEVTNDKVVSNEKKEEVKPEVYRFRFEKTKRIYRQKVWRILKNKFQKANLKRKHLHHN